MDKRWCDNCGKEGGAYKGSPVEWYDYYGIETSLCKKCVRNLRNDYVELIPLSEFGD